MKNLENGESQRDLSSEKIDEYFSGLEFCLDIYQSSKKEQSIYLTDEFNVFNYIQPDENKLSNIIADLLNTNGAHGQGNIFLNVFLKLLDSKKFQKLDEGVVFREESIINQRRIDITIHGKNMGIGIENKPWAEDLENQIDDYINELNYKYNGYFFFVYFSGSGKPPPNYSISEEKRRDLENEKKFKTLAYNPGMKKWIDNCIKECKADKMKWFLLDFSDYLKTNFTNNNLEKNQ